MIGQRTCRGGKACPTRARNNSHCWLAGPNQGMSYRTCLFQLLPPEEGGNCLLLNETYYSVTSSGHRTHLFAWHLPPADEVLYLVNVPQGTWDLWAWAQAEQPKRYTVRAQLNHGDTIETFGYYSAQEAINVARKLTKPGRVYPARADRAQVLSPTGLEIFHSPAK